jgi:hypothetical protein
MMGTGRNRTWEMGDGRWVMGDVMGDVVMGDG